MEVIKENSHSYLGSERVKQVLSADFTTCAEMGMGNLHVNRPNLLAAKKKYSQS